MKIEKIDKWLDDEYGISYTELVKIKEYLAEENEKIKKMNMYEHKYGSDMEEKYLIEKSRIDKAIEYMNNTFDISSVKDMFDIMNNLEDILRGDKE